MTKYTTNIKGNVTGIVQGDGVTVVIQDGKVTRIERKPRPTKSKKGKS